MPTPSRLSHSAALRFFLAASLLLSVLAPASIASPLGQVGGATLTILAGLVEVAPGGGSFAAARDGQDLAEGDAVRTGTDGTALLTFFNGSETVLAGDSYVALNSISSGAAGISLFQAAGTTLNRIQGVASGSLFQTDTPVATGLVRGTAYAVTVRPPAGTTAGTIQAAGLRQPSTPTAVPATATLPPVAVVPPVTGPVVTYPRVIDETGYLLLGEAFYPDTAGFWQVRTWQDPATAGTWDTFERLGLGSSLLGEAMYVQGGMLWRVRSWRATDGFTWDTFESLGSATQGPAGTQQAASLSAAPLGAPTASGHDTVSTFVLVRGSIDVARPTGGTQTNLTLTPGQVVGWNSDTQVVGTLSDPALNGLRQWDANPRDLNAINGGQTVTRETGAAVETVLQQGTNVPPSQPLLTRGSVLFQRITRVDTTTGTPTSVKGWSNPDTGAGSGTPPPPPPPSGGTTGGSEPPNPPPSNPPPSDTGSSSSSATPEPVDNTDYDPPRPATTPTPLPTVSVITSTCGTPAPAVGGAPALTNYVVKTSGQTGGPAFQWTEISQTGSNVSGLSNVDDVCAGPVPLPFDFPFYGQKFNRVFINANGQLTFVVGSAAYSNATIPSPSSPNLFIAPFWDDTDSRCRTDDGIFFQAFGSGANAYVVFEWLNWDHYSCSGGGIARYTFQAIISRNGTIKFQYLNMLDQGTASVGIENQTGTMGVPFTGTLTNNLAVRFVPSGTLTPTPVANPPRAVGLVSASVSATPTPTLVTATAVRSLTPTPTRAATDTPTPTASPPGTPTAIGSQTPTPTPVP